MNSNLKFVFLLIVVLHLTQLTSAQIIVTVGGGGSSLGDGGLATLAQILLPSRGDFNESGDLFFMQNSGAPRIRKIDAMGIITTVAGNGTASYSGDGGPATMAAIRPQGGDIGRNNSYYIADYYNNRIRQVDLTTGIITTIAGDGTYASSGDGGLASAAQISSADLVVDSIGNLFVDDQVAQTTRKIGVDGRITTVANINGSGMAFNKHGRLVMGIATRIVSVDTATGHIDTIAGTGIATYNGEGLAALSANIKVRDIAFDDTGNLYFADDANDRVRKIDTFGIVTTVAGTGVAGYSGDGGPAIAAKVYNPEGVAVDPCGNLWVADDANNRIRKIVFNAYSTPTVTVTGMSSATVGATVSVHAAVSGGVGAYRINWYRNGTLLAVTDTPGVTYIKGMGTDTISAHALPSVVYCSDSAASPVWEVAEIPVGIADVRRMGVTIYPNPTRGMLHVNGEGPLEEVALETVTGQAIVNMRVQGMRAEMDMSGLPAGLYLLRVNRLQVYKVWRE